jgi:hypothetical protein
MPPVHREVGGFSTGGRKGLNRLRFTGRLRGRALRAGAYRLSAEAIDRTAVASAASPVRFWIR